MADDPLLIKYKPILTRPTALTADDIRKVEQEFETDTTLPTPKIKTPGGINFYELQNWKNNKCKVDPKSVDCIALRRIALAAVRGVRDSSIRKKFNEYAITGMPEQLSTFYGTCDEVFNEATQVENKSVNAQLENAWDYGHIAAADTQNPEKEKKITARIQDYLNGNGLTLGKHASPKTMDNDKVYNLKITSPKIEEKLNAYIRDKKNTEIFDVVDELDWKKRVNTGDREMQSIVLSECALFAPSYNRAKLLALLRERQQKDARPHTEGHSITRVVASRERPQLSDISKEMMTEMETIAMCRSASMGTEILSVALNKIDLVYGSHILRLNSAAWECICPSTVIYIKSDKGVDKDKELYAAFKESYKEPIDFGNVPNKKLLDVRSILNWMYDLTDAEYGEIIVRITNSETLRDHDIRLTPKINEMLFLANPIKYAKRIPSSSTSTKEDHHEEYAAHWQRFADRLTRATTPNVLKSHKKDNTKRALLKSREDEAKSEAENELLKDAIQQNNEERVRKLLEAGEAIDATDGNGFTTLMRACQAGHDNYALALIKAGADVNKEGGAYGFNALMLAAQNGHDLVILALIKAGAAVDTQNPKGWTALMHAAQNKHELCLLELIRAGAAVDAASKIGFTALILSARNGHEQCLLALLKAGATVDKQGGPDNATALMIACQNGHVVCALALLKAGADLNKANAKGFVALMHACQNGHVGCALSLLNAGAAIDHAAANGATALMLAAQNNHERVARELIKAGANASYAKVDGWTALMFCAQNGNEHIAQALIEAKANLEAALPSGHTSLMIACQNGHDLVALALIKAKADVDAVNAGFTALMISAKNGHYLCTRELIKAGANASYAKVDGWTALMFCGQNGNEQIALALLEAGAAVDAANNAGVTALMVAASGNRVQCVRTLIKAKANLEVYSNDGGTALMYAATNGHDLCAQALIEAKAELEATQNKGFTALMLSAQHGHYAVVMTLLNAGAAVDHAAANGATALMLSCAAGSDSVASELIRAGAGVDAASNTGMTALMYAASRGHQKCLQYLLNEHPAVNLTNKDGNTALMLAKVHNQGKTAKTLEVYIEVQRVVAQRRAAQALPYVVD